VETTKCVVVEMWLPTFACLALAALERLCRPTFLPLLALRRQRVVHPDELLAGADDRLGDRLGFGNDERR
jgi:hypothetical protein